MVRQRDGRQVKVDKIKSGLWYIWYIWYISGTYIWQVRNPYYGCTKVVFTTKPV